MWFKVENDHHSKFSNLSNWKEEAWKNTGAMLYQLSYEATHLERGQFVWTKATSLNPIEALIFSSFFFPIA